MRYQLLLAFSAAVVVAAPGHAQDPVRVDPKHYSVEHEDAHVRVLRIRFGPGEKSVMHAHPNSGCLVRLTDEHSRHTTPDGKSTESRGAAGSVACTDKPGRYRHLPENLSDKPMELVLMERKSPKGKR